MLKMDQASKWTPKGRAAFEDIKKEISSAPVLVNLNFSKDFIMYVYGSKHSIAAILT